MKRIRPTARAMLGPIAVLTLALPSLLSPTAEARPEKIRPGMSYYSDDYVEAGGVRDIADEKNYEEVYQHYTFYEAIYDDDGRVVRFIEYKKGEELSRLDYAYGPDGSLLTRTLERPGAAPEVTRIEAGEGTETAPTGD